VKVADDLAGRTSSTKTLTAPIPGYIVVSSGTGLGVTCWRTFEAKVIEASSKPFVWEIFRLNAATSPIEQSKQVASASEVTMAELLNMQQQKAKNRAALSLLGLWLEESKAPTAEETKGLDANRATLDASRSTRKLFP